MLVIRSIFLIALTSLTLVAEARDQAASRSRIPTVAFCDLVRYSNRYDKKIVRTTAIYGAYYHGTFLYDPSCKTPDANVDVAGLEEERRFKTSSRVKRQLQKLMSQSEKDGAHRARVSVIGRFNDWNGIGYGHLDGSRFQIDLLAFESAKPVAASIGWNAKGDVADSFMTVVAGIKHDDVAWNFAYLLNNAAELENFLPDDYVLTNEQGVLKKSQVISIANRNGRIGTGGAIVEKQRVFLNGNTAVVTGRATSGNCKNIIRQYQFTNRYVERNGYWQIVSSQIVHTAPVKVTDNLPCN